MSSLLNVFFGVQGGVFFGRGGGGVFFGGGGLGGFFLGVGGFWGVGMSFSVPSDTILYFPPLCSRIGIPAPPEGNMASPPNPVAFRQPP